MEKPENATTQLYVRREPGAYFPQMVLAQQARQFIYSNGADGAIAPGEWTIQDMTTERGFVLPDCVFHAYYKLA